MKGDIRHKRLAWQGKQDMICPPFPLLTSLAPCNGDPNLPARALPAAPFGTHQSGTGPACCTGVTLLDECFHLHYIVS